MAILVEFAMAEQI